MDNLPWHVTDRIFAELKIRELLNAGLVCKSWHRAMLREISRRGPELVLIPDVYRIQYPQCSQRLDANFHMFDLLNVQPHVSIFFVGPNKRERNLEHTEEDTLNFYRTYLNKYLIAVGVDQCTEDETDIRSCTGELGPANGTLGLFIPQCENLGIDIATVNSQEPSTIKYVAQYRIFVKSLNLEAGNRAERSTFLFFAGQYSNNSVVNRLLHIIKSNLRPQVDTLWGGSFAGDLRCLGPSDEAQTQANIVCIHIHGSRLQSWSIVIDCRISEYEFRWRLVKFRDALKLRRCTIGLACGPRYVEKDLETDVNDYIRSGSLIMNAVKSVFPTIPFIGAFNFGHRRQFGVSSMSTSSNQNLSNKMALSLLIMTYD